MNGSCEEPANRWSHVKKILERNGPLSSSDFEPCPELFDFVRNDLKILVIGAGGLGCELLKVINNLILNTC